MAEIFIKKNNNGSVAAVWKISETFDELIEMIPFSPEMKSKLVNFKNQSRKIEWLVSRILLFNHTGLIPNIEYNEVGQPFIWGFDKKISISHTTGYAAVVISETDFAGIDIEQPKERILRVAQKFINPIETAFVPKNEDINYYTLIWCAKETLFKMLKKREINFIEDLIIFPFIIENKGIIKAKVAGNPPTEFDLEYIVTPEYHLVWHF
ncbi:MAG: 4'-phosphopantetheinyl transferase superfamily protein [Marinilabiliaceae bacterium]|nr:4'-phosphopantetheinyl transferase superfamily protein [Marinilabiliaceae bacterium]